MWEEVKRQPENLETGPLLSECGFVQRIAPASLCRDTSKKVHQSINT